MKGGVKRSLVMGQELEQADQEHLTKKVKMEKEEKEEEEDRKFGAESENDEDEDLFKMKFEK
jgi:hypothetical protein